MQHEIDACRGAFGKRRVGKIAFEELGTAEVFEVAAFAGNEIIGDADSMSAPQQLFRKM